MKHQIMFLLAGMIAGLICVALGLSGSPKIAIIGLTWGVGPLFSVALLAGIAITGAWRYLKAGVLRYLAALVIGTIIYMVALATFFGVFGYSPDWFGVRPSANMVDFGIDVWLGLIAAVVVGASGIALLAAFLTGKWSNSLLLRLLLAGIVTIVVTFIVNLPFHNYLSFFGVLLPLGTSLFCGAVGAQIWKYTEVSTRMAPTTA